MDEKQPNAENYRRETGPLGILGLDEGEIADHRTVAGDAYQVVYPQESVWVLDMRLTSDDGTDTAIFRVVLRAPWAYGGGIASGDAIYTRWCGREALNG